MDIMSNKKSLLKKDTQKLTKKQEAFVNELLLTPDKPEQAAKRAGYSDKAARTIAYTNMRIPHVMDEYKSRLWHKLSIGAGISVNTLNELAHKSKSDKVKLAAAANILDRVGFKQQQASLGNGQVAITINLGDPGATQPKTIDAQVVDTTDQDVIPPHDGISYGE